MRFKIIHKIDGECYIIGCLEAACKHHAASRVAEWRDMFDNKLDLRKTFIQACSDDEWELIIEFVETKNREAALRN